MGLPSVVGVADLTPLDPSSTSIEYDGSIQPRKKRRKTSVVYGPLHVSDACVAASQVDHQAISTEEEGHIDARNNACDSLASMDGKNRKRCNVIDMGIVDLESLDSLSFPKPLEHNHLSDIVKKIHEDLNEENVVCSVCDEICLLSRTEILDVPSLPPSFFTVLRKPTGIDGDASVLPQELADQYDISHHFPDDARFKDLLLSPRGVKKSTCTCQGSTCKGRGSCSPLLYVCVSGCWQALRRGSIPKFAIAQGNYVGQLPEELRSMTFGSRCLIRPMQSFGRLASFYNGGGMRLTGHVYSNKLNTPIVRKKLPINPGDVPIRVLVVSPLATDASTAARARMAAIKQEYIIQPDKINGTLQFFQKVGNKAMESIEFNEDVLRELPKDDVSVDMFHADTSASECETEEESAEDINEISQRTDDNDKTGGPWLSRTNAEADETVMVSSTVTIGAAAESDRNVHEEVVRVLNNEVVQRSKGIIWVT